MCAPLLALDDNTCHTHGEGRGESELAGERARPGQELGREKGSASMRGMAVSSAELHRAEAIPSSGGGVSQVSSYHLQPELSGKISKIHIKFYKNVIFSMMETRARLGGSAVFVERTLVRTTLGIAGPRNIVLEGTKNSCERNILS